MAKHNKSDIPRSADNLVDILIPLMKEEQFIDRLKADPEKVVKQLADSVTRNLPTPALVSDKGIYGIAVFIAGLMGIISAVGIVWLSLVGGDGITIPESLTAISSAAIGGLVGLLAPVLSK